MSHFIGDDGKSYPIFGENGAKSQAKSLGVAFLGKIPMEMALREGSDKGIPYMSNEKHQKNEAWKCFISVAEKLSQSDKKTSSKFLGRLFGK